LKKHGDPQLRSGFPVLGKQAPQVGRNRVLLAQGGIDHGKHWAFTLIDALQKEGNDGILDIVAIEIARDRASESGEGGGDVVRHPLARGIGARRHG